MITAKILVMGGGGMLGHKMFQAAAAAFEDAWCTLSSSRNDYPLTDITEFRSTRIIEHFDAAAAGATTELLRRLRPDVVVNCIGITKQQVPNYDDTMIVAVNAELPHLVAATLSEWRGKLVHISTDCVFDGAAGYYSEEDPPNATDLYGQTKAQGEVVAENTLVLRTSIIGRELRRHASLLEWFLRQSGRTISGYRSAWWSGVTTNHLAQLIVSILENHPNLAGLYHVSSGRMSKYQLLHLLRDAFNLGVTIEPDDDYTIDRSLLGRKLEAAIAYKRPAWASLVRELVTDRTPYRAAAPLPI